MKRVLWATPILFVLMSGNIFADSVTTTIFLQPNNGSGDNFGALQTGNGMVIGVGGGVAYDIFNIGPYAPGSALGGTTDFFIEGGFAPFGGNTYELSPLSRRTANKSLRFQSRLALWRSWRALILAKPSIWLAAAREG